MKKIAIILFSFLFLTNIANSESRFGELTEIRDEIRKAKSCKKLKLDKLGYNCEDLQNQKIEDIYLIK